MLCISTELSTLVSFILWITINYYNYFFSTGNSGGEFEKQPFLPTEPVRLTPAWEETNLPNDELNFKGVTMEQAQLEMNPPVDR